MTFIQPLEPVEVRDDDTVIFAVINPDERVLQLIEYRNWGNYLEETIEQLLHSTVCVQFVQLDAYTQARNESFVSHLVQTTLNPLPIDAKPVSISEKLKSIFSLSNAEMPITSKDVKLLVDFFKDVDVNLLDDFTENEVERVAFDIMVKILEEEEAIFVHYFKEISRYAISKFDEYFEIAFLAYTSDIAKADSGYRKELSKLIVENEMEDVILSRLTEWGASYVYKDPYYLSLCLFDMIGCKEIEDNKDQYKGVLKECFDEMLTDNKMHTYSLSREECEAVSKLLFYFEISFNILLL